MSRPVEGLTDDLRRQHFSELGRRAVQSRRARKEAVARVVAATRKAQGLPPTVDDVEVLGRVADLIATSAEVPNDVAS